MVLLCPDVTLEGDALIENVERPVGAGAAPTVTVTPLFPPQPKLLSYTFIWYRVFE
jgi:hypothetical protein